MTKAKIAVVGAGLIGFSTAVCISDSIPSCTVTVIADRFTPNTTSDVAAGMLIPHVFPGDCLAFVKALDSDLVDCILQPVCELSACYLRKINRMGLIFAHCAHSASFYASIATIKDLSLILDSMCTLNYLSKPFIGISWQIFKTVPKEETPFWSDVVLGFRSMTEKEMKKFPQHKCGQAFTTLKCDCPPYLLWLEKRLKENGGHVHVRKIEDLWELHSDYDIVVNCSGLGSQKLIRDREIYPIRGQVLKVHAPWIRHFIRDGDGLTYIYPGIHDVTLGGTRQKDNWNLSPDPNTSKGILGRCCALEPSLHTAKDVKVRVGLRPSRSAVRLQKEVLVRGSEKLHVVHNYGHSGGGFSVHQGTAQEATRLVKECIAALEMSRCKSKL